MEVGLGFVLVLLWWLVLKGFTVLQALKEALSAGFRGPNSKVLASLQPPPPSDFSVQGLTPGLWLPPPSALSPNTQTQNPKPFNAPEGLNPKQSPETLSRIIRKSWAQRLLEASIFISSQKG